MNAANSGALVKTLGGVDLIQFLPPIGQVGLVLLKSEIRVGWPHFYVSLESDGCVDSYQRKVGMSLGSELKPADRFAAYINEVTKMIGHADREVPFRDYCVSVLATAGRRNVEPMDTFRSNIRRRNTTRSSRAAAGVDRDSANARQISPLTSESFFSPKKSSNRLIFWAYVFGTSDCRYDLLPIESQQVGKVYLNRDHDCFCFPRPPLCVCG
jgi:hypothetical protein